MQFKRQGKTEEGVNLTPLIDVVFLLLIFFMVSTTFTKETHLSIDLPEASGEPLQQEPQQVEIVINADGHYTVNGRTLINTKMETLLKALQELPNAAHDKPVIITSDANAKHQAFVTAMDAAGKAGFSAFSVTTMNPAPPGSGQ